MLPHLTWKVLSFKKFLMKFAIRPLMPALWIFISSAVLLTLSNAFLRSRNTANVCFFGLESSLYGVDNLDEAVCRAAARSKAVLFVN